MPFELVMKTDLAKAIPQAIEFNYDELKMGIDDRLTYYKNLVVTEESIKSAKSDKAKLNKLKSAFEDARKEVKQECLKPYYSFEDKIKTLTGPVDECVDSIGGQLQTFDDQKKQEKQAEIVTFFSANIGGLAALLPFKKINNPRWLNASYKMADIEKEIKDTIFKVKNNISIIKAFGVECEQQMLDKYLETLDMGAAMAEKTRWEEQQKRLKEYEESQKKAQEPHTVVIDGTPGHDLCDAKPGDHVVFADSPDSPTDSHIPEPDECPPMQEATKTIRVEFRDTTAAFRHEMHDLCVKYGIAYGWAK